VLEQSRPLEEVFIVDDGSTQSTPELPGVRVVRMETNQGRGAARARAMQEAKYELVLGCDASLMLDRSFLSVALPWFEDTRVAAVFGWIKQVNLSHASNRWCGRHLFRSDMVQHFSLEKTLASGCFVVRRSAVESVGGFNRALRFGEDADLGRRLRAEGYTVIFDPKLYARSDVDNGVLGVLERYTRWNSPGGFGVWDYVRQVNYSLKVMVAADLKAGDLPSALISLLCQHYQFWTNRNISSRLSGKVDRLCK
jgi:cellulose synthase/poly-beta-1,6-N-acetylglucosamine synthase-like glycosyltransferase